MKNAQLIFLSLFMVTGSAYAVMPSSSLTLQYGPSFPAITSPITKLAQPAYDFGVDQFWNSNGTTAISITMTEHIEPAVDGIGLSGEICACISGYVPPPVYSLSFSIEESVIAPYSGSQYISNYYSDFPIEFFANVPGLIEGGLLTLKIGEIDTQLDNNGYQILTRFAVDFTVQAGEFSFAETNDPETGYITYTPQFSEYPGNWFAGSLRYQSDTEAFAYLAPIPEPTVYIQMLAGLGLLGLVKFRRKQTKI